MEKKTLSLIQIAAAALFYTNAARKPTRRGLGGPEVSVPMHATMKAFSGIMAFEALKGLGYSDALSAGLVLASVGAWEWHLVSSGQSSAIVVGAESFEQERREERHEERHDRHERDRREGRGGEGREGEHRGWGRHYAGDGGVTVLPPPPRVPVTYTPAYMPHTAPPTTYVPSNVDIGPGF